MAKPPNKLTTDYLGRLIYEIRDQRVMLDSDLAAIYGVSTKRLLEQVRRNLDRFPRDFAFQITRGEQETLRSQIATLAAQNLRPQSATSRSHGGRRYLPYVFTVHGPKVWRDSALVSSGVNVQWSNCISTSVYYDGEISRANYDNHSLTGAVRIGF